MSVPSRPGAFVITSYTNTRVNGDADPGSNGGKPILEWQLAWGTHPTTANFTGTLSSDGSGFVAGLVPGATYYFWNRQRNADGWSALSPMTKVTMKDAPDAPKAPILWARTQTSITVMVVPTEVNGARVTNYSLVYGQSPTDSDNLVVNGTQSRFGLTNLDPGKTYYFWGRATNIYGDSAWSARSQFNLLAGAWVKQNGVWRRAVPYVKVGGVWKMARPWSRKAGVWKEASD